MNPALLDICLIDLFTDKEQLLQKYTADISDSILRIRDMYLWLVATPSVKDAAFVREDCLRYKVSRPTAYNDLNIIKSLIPTVAKSSKDFNTWKFTEMILETYNMAKMKKDIRTMERAAASFAKYTGIDKVEEEKLPLDKIIPQPFVPTDDPSVLGFKPIPNRREVIKKLIDKYSRDIPDILDVDYEDADYNHLKNPDTSHLSPDTSGIDS